MPDFTIDDFMQHVAVSDVPFDGSPCWIWTGRLDADGYGTLPGRHGARDLAGIFAHRYSVVALRGQALFDAKVVNHRCRQRSCVNPAHLEVITNAENVLHPESMAPSAINARKTHCINGHEFTDENTKLNSYGNRVCRTCDRAYQIAYQRARRARARNDL